VAVSSEPGTANARTLVLIFDSDTKKYGLTLTTSRYGKPKLRGGEAFVFVDIKLAHCRPS
jgi:hypothetical protein